MEWWLWRMTVYYLLFILPSCDIDDPNRIFRAIENEYDLRIGLAGIIRTTGNEIIIMPIRIFPLHLSSKNPSLLNYTVNMIHSEPTVRRLYS